MTAPRVEDEYQDVLQNIEATVAECYLAYPALTDWEVEAAYTQMARRVRALADNWPEPQNTLSGTTRVVYEAISEAVLWRLGLAPLADESGNLIPAPEPVEPAAMLLCLKRLQRSVKLWNKEGGRQGYLNFTSQFVAE